MVSQKEALLVSIVSSGALALWYYHSIWRKDSQGDTSENRGAIGSSVEVRASSLNGEKRRADEVDYPPHLKREMVKEARRQAKVPILSRKSPMYDNVRMIDAGGELLCTISAKKARWYVKKQLATWTDSYQKCIQLKFEPKGRSARGELGSLVKLTKNNVCVSCGDDEYHMRHYVVPYAYRSRLPQKYKSHLSHDIVILCPKCHLHCEQECQKRMKQIEDAVRNSRGDNSHVPFSTDSRLYNVRSNALALLRWKHKVPESKIVAYEQTVRDHLNLGKDVDLTTDLLQSAVDVEYRIPNPDYIGGAELVVQALGNNDKEIERFVKDWRMHFIETVHPHFLPDGWSVESPVTSDSR